MSKIPEDIVPDVEIARVALHYWPEPTHYQAQVMTTIALCESGGNRYALYMNTSGLFTDCLDRGLWGINEAAINEVVGVGDVYASEFADPWTNGWMAWHIWDWRYKTATKNEHALVRAYSGWTTYKIRTTDPQMKAAWPIMWNRAAKAIALALTP